jgi:hypothetical protein
LNEKLVIKGEHTLDGTARSHVFDNLVKLARGIGLHEAIEWETTLFIWGEQAGSCGARHT